MLSANPTLTNDIIKVDISTNNNEDVLTEKNHIHENSKSNLNRRDKLLKNDSTDKVKQVSNIRPNCVVSPETSSPKLCIEIVGDSIINGITSVGLSSKCEHRFRVKPYGGAISESLIDHIRPTIRRKPAVIAIHIGTNDISAELLDDFISEFYFYIDIGLVMT